MSVTTQESRVSDPTEAGLLFLEPDTYVDERLFLDAAAVLREQDPVHRVEHPEYPPVTLLTRHADITDVTTNPKTWIQARPQSLKKFSELAAVGKLDYPLPRFLVNMDGEEHRAYRDLTKRFFTPRGLAVLNDRLTDLARVAADEMVERGGECDFAEDIAMQYPMRVILALLGLPDEDHPLMLRLTQQMLCPSDPEFAVYEGATSGETFANSVQEFFEYFLAVRADRRANPRDDLATLIATADIPSLDLAELPMAEAVGYYVIFAVAGHDTSASSIAAGMRALIEHPDQLQRLRDDPSLVSSASEEIIRWASPSRHFLRTSAHPTTIGDVEFAAGENVFMSWPSANHDPEVFDQPDVFDIGRFPNPHLSFGHGPHFCLGAHLARMELNAVFTELIPRLDNVELAGTPEVAASISAGGLKHLPIRYEIRP